MDIELCVVIVLDVMLFYIAYNSCFAYYIHMAERLYGLSSISNELMISETLPYRRMDVGSNYKTVYRKHVTIIMYDIDASFEMFCGKSIDFLTTDDASSDTTMAYLSVCLNKFRHV